MQEPLFADADDAFLRHLALIIKPCIFLPGEFIVHKGDVGLSMFLLFHGQVQLSTFLVVTVYLYLGICD